MDERSRTVAHLYELLLPLARADGTTSPVIVATSGPRERDLDLAGRGLGPEGTLLLVCERPWARTIVRLLVRRVWSPPWPRPRAAIRLRRAGMTVAERYAVWPDVNAPRIAVPLRNYRAVRWLQRDGVLGGGGRSLLVRALARSRFATPLVWLLAPGIALVARKPESPSG